MPIYRVKSERVQRSWYTAEIAVEASSKDEAEALALIVYDNDYVEEYQEDADNDDHTFSAEINPSPLHHEREATERMLRAYATIGSIREEWDTDPDEWGLLGPTFYDDDERVRWTRTPDGWLLERQQDDVWYAALTERRTTDDVINTLI